MSKPEDQARALIDGVDCTGRLLGFVPAFLVDLFGKPVDICAERHVGEQAGRGLRAGVGHHVVGRTLCANLAEASDGVEIIEHLRHGIGIEVDEVTQIVTEQTMAGDLGDEGGLGRARRQPAPGDPYVEGVAGGGNEQLVDPKR